MARHRPRHRQNGLSGIVFGFAVLLAVAAAVHLASAPPEPGQADGLSVAGRAAGTTSEAIAGIEPAATQPSAALAAIPSASDDAIAPPPAAEAVATGAPVDVPAEAPESDDSLIGAVLHDGDVAVEDSGVAVEDSAGAVENAAVDVPVAPAPIEASFGEVAPDEYIAPAEDDALSDVPPAAAPAPRRSLDVGTILGLLRSQGFSSFSSVAQQGDAYVFQAQKGGQPVQVTVDAGTGSVLAVQ